ncbi:hypothetical protein J2797_003073 [Paraburkholderia terricola]|uniref:SMEK domain-containing protein n=1 Tax=Paraburkholderia terricola TaxID=169427 RepID=UPI00286477F7|nr:SMEK domain-containing protein [Paraburkholderia terricola]MDR6493177.1 hypothetical protein [Paraburkholderia terricola]
MNRATYIQKITHALAVLSARVKINASLNLLDLNIHAENFFRDLLNLAFGYKLVNLNSVDHNTKSIDLGDSLNRLAFQVTSTSSLKKTRATVDGFISDKKYTQYARLIIFNIVEASEHREPFIGIKGVFQLETANDIWDCRTFVRMILDKDLTTIKKIADFLDVELHSAVQEEAIPKEVQTVLALIEILSDDEHPAAGNGFIEKPDPEGKIYKRFSSQSIFLTEKYVEHYAIYGEILRGVSQQSDLGPVKIRKIASYLRSYSDRVLTANHGDPVVSLEIMTEYFTGILANKGIEYDSSAVEFFLVDQLIRCNVFPRATEKL